MATPNWLFTSESDNRPRLLYLGTVCVWEGWTDTQEDGRRREGLRPKNSETKKGQENQEKEAEIDVLRASRREIQT